MKILVFNPSFLGDSVLTTPLIKALKTIYPHAAVDFCVRPEYVSLFEGLSFINEVIPFDKRNTESGFSGLISFTKKIRAKKYDLLVSAHKSIRSTFMAAFSGAGKTIGFSESSLSTMYDEGVHRDMSIHEAERNLMLLAPLNAYEQLFQAKDAGGKLATYTDSELLAKAAAYFKEIAGDKKLIGINPGSVWETKKWPAERFAHIIDNIQNKGYACVVVGGPSDKETVDKVKQHCKTEFIDLCGKTSLRELPSYIKQFSMMITNDSGPMHIAVSQEVPCIALFGPTISELGFTPYDTTSIVMENHQIICRPCGLHGGKVCKEKHFRCMNDITEYEVMEQFAVMCKRLNI